MLVFGRKFGYVIDVFLGNFMSVKNSKALFVGIGGMGMAPLAIYLKEMGASVCGYNDGMKPRMKTLLERYGIRILETISWPEVCDLVVYSNAISCDAHPLMQMAKERGVRCVRRGEFLAEVVQDKRLVAVVGSHGKTTTTGYLIHILQRSGFRFGYLLGGLFRDDVYPPGHYDAGSEWVVAEVDESDGSIECFSPEITLMSNFDWDHADYYKTEEALVETFARLLQRTRLVGVLPEDAEGSRIFGKLSGRVSTKLYTFGGEGDFRGIGVHDGAQWALQLGGLLGNQKVPLKGYLGFNVKNVTLALAGTHLMMGKGAKIATKAIRDFKGVERRQDVLHQSEKGMVVADYAHHPSEIQAFLDFMKVTQSGKQVVVFQPHRYTRTQRFARDFAQVLKVVDEVILLDVFAASEQPVVGGSIEDLLAMFDGWEHVKILDKAVVPQQLMANIFDEKTNILFIGAGDINEVAKTFVHQLEEIIRERLLENKSPQCPVIEHEPLSNKTTFRIGGKARYYAEPENLEDLQSLVKAAHLVGMKVFILGCGSNVLVPDEGFHGLVIRLNHAYWRRLEVVDSEHIKVGAGVYLNTLCRKALECGWGGLEFLDGIPGTVGGALRMNAGARGFSMGNVVDSVDVVERNGDVQMLTVEQLHFQYRACEELRGRIVLGAVLNVHLVNDMTPILEKIKAWSAKRRSSQPVGLHAGCFFKNPSSENPAGKVIDQMGLRGKKIGGAMVSEMHANFIVNTGTATSGDVVKLANHVRTKALRVGIDLQPEVELMGKHWEDVFRV